MVSDPVLRVTPFYRFIYTLVIKTTGPAEIVEMFYIIRPW